MKSILVGAILLLLSFSGFARTYPLFKIHNLVENKLSKMELVESKEGKAEVLRQELLAKPRTVRKFDLNRITEGIVLEEQKGYKVVILKGEDVDFERGGNLKVEFLVNAISSKKSSKDFKIQKEKDDWKLYHRGLAIDMIRIVGNKVPFVGVVGVKEIQIKYEGEKEFFGVPLQEKEDTIIDVIKNWFKGEL